ncbi:hypothetical protein [Moraxella lacunata]|uniref:hypothetical protein n=1 Tax=Moraxella lacunata TaxID=477 RepID=UPI003EDE9497
MNRCVGVNCHLPCDRYEYIAHLYGKNYLNWLMLCFLKMPICRLPNPKSTLIYPIAPPQLCLS